MADFYRQVEAAILEPDPRAKCELAAGLRQAWAEGCRIDDAARPIQPVDDPGRPARPRLVDPRRLERRSFASEPGRIRMLHAFAHIEFNAINIALDAAYRFRRVPPAFIADWLRVATEEARHFELLQAELLRRGSGYGDFPAHRGLWDMVCKTRGDLLHRMALVPRVMEARGLDVTPAMIERFRQFGDEAAAGILEVIYRDEIGHVRIGDCWFRYLCDERGLDAEQTFRELVDIYLDGKLRGPFNRPARIEAGFGARELDALEHEV